MLRVLTYHRVDHLHHTPRLHPGIISATPEAFRLQMQYVAKYYHPISIEEVLEAVEQGTRLPRRAVLLTFDDAYCDFGTIAWPILKRYGIPAVLFVPTGYPGHPERTFWWDRLYCAITYTSQNVLLGTPLGTLALATPEQRHTSLRSLQQYIKTLPHAEAMHTVEEVCTRLGVQQQGPGSILDWEALRQLAREGVTLGAHTQTHPIMTQLSPQQVRQEVVGAQQDLRREIGRVFPIFCYPNGNCDDVILHTLREEGFVLAFTTHGGQNNLYAENLLRLSRTNITRRTSLPIFRLRLSRVGIYVDMWRHRRH